MKKLLLPIFAALLASVISAAALTVWTSGNGDVAIPGLGTATIDNMAIGNTTPSSGKFTTLNASSQITTSAGLPTIASGACGTTTNGAIVAGSTNQAGQITIGSAATTSCTVSFSATLAAAPKMCVFSPMNAAAIAATTLPYMAAPTTGGFVLNGAVLASTNWGYVCL
jgi:hypothetical protein